MLAIRSLRPVAPLLALLALAGCQGLALAGLAGSLKARPEAPWTTYFLRAPRVWLTLPDGSRPFPESDRVTRVETPRCSVRIDSRSPGPSDVIAAQDPGTTSRLKIRTAAGGASIEGIMRDGQTMRYGVHEYRAKGEGFVACHGYGLSGADIACLRRVCASLQTQMPPVAELH